MYQNIFGFGLFVASFAGISEGLAEEGGREEAWGRDFMLMTVASFTELECFLFCLSFNKLNEDLSGKVDKYSRIRTTIELGLISPAERILYLYTK